ncbi:MAG: HAMP domain-containing protein [Rhodoferax sp.]|nr:HAMP domain-containing protein [Rhodoferax sp.]
MMTMRDLFKTYRSRLRREAASLRAAIVLTVLTGVIVPSGIISYQAQQQLKEEFIERLAGDLVTSTELLAKNVQEPLWNYAKEDIVVLVDAAMADEKIMAIEIVKNEDGIPTPFFSWRRAAKMPVPEKTHSVLVKRNGGAIGAVTVTVDAESYRHRLKAALDRDIFRVLQTLLGSLVLILLLLHIRLVTPLRRLVRASAELEKGNLSQPIASGYRDELGQLARSLEATRQALAISFEELEQRVKQRTSALSAACEVADTARQRAIQALNDLRETQTQLIQSEKMASMGQLVTNVAHELNTPISAVKSSGQSISDALNDVLVSMPNLFAILDQPARNLFIKLIFHSGGAAKTLLTPREERIVRRDTCRELEAAGIVEPESKARVLVQLGVQQALANYLPLLLHPECDAILSTAQSISAIINSTLNINTAVERVSRIIFALNSFTPPNTMAPLRDADLHTGLDDVLTLYQSQINQTATTLVRQYEQIPPLRCQPDQLNQVWNHLIHNALQAMTHQGTLTISIHRVENEAVIAISDTGCGIPESIQEKIFAPFFTTRLAGEGSGLGLHSATKIIDWHQGRITVQSEAGVGSTFSVYLPYSFGPS